MAFYQSSKRIATRYLDPADRLQEVPCRLITVLEFTLIGGLAAWHSWVLPLRWADE